MTRHHPRRLLAAGAAVALLVSVLGACGSDTSDSGDSPASQSGNADGGPDATSGDQDATDGDSEQPSDADQAPPDDADGGSIEPPAGEEAITIPIAAGWSEDVAVSHLWKYVLEKRGYTVSVPTLDIGPIIDGVANDKYDVFFDVTLPRTHKKYWDKYGDQVTDFGPWFDTVTLTITVPDYMDIDSMDQLESIGDKVDKTITGIDAGAGLTDATKNSMMPAYGLDKAGWNLKVSSTAAMLASLKKATDDKKPIVVTLWHPHWAYSALPIKDLDDPKGAMGKPDKDHAIGSPQFTENHPELAEPLKNFHMDDDTLASLESVTVQDPDMTGDEIQDAAGQWADDHQAFIDSFMK